LHFRADEEASVLIAPAKCQRQFVYFLEFPPSFRHFSSSDSMARSSWPTNFLLKWGLL